MGGELSSFEADKRMAEIVNMVFKCFNHPEMSEEDILYAL